MAEEYGFTIQNQEERLAELNADFNKRVEQIKQRVPASRQGLYIATLMNDLGMSSRSRAWIYEEWDRCLQGGKF